MARMISLERSSFTEAATMDCPSRLCGLCGRPVQPDLNRWRQAVADDRVNRAGAQFMNDSSQDNAVFPRLNRS